MTIGAATNSPVGSSMYAYGQDNQHSHHATSPNNSDGNDYQSPSVSPGSWNMTLTTPTYATVSPQSNASHEGSPGSVYFQGSPASASSEVRASPPSTPPPSFQPPALPTELGTQRKGAKSENDNKKKQQSINRRFMEKSPMDQEREKAANRRLQSMMLEVSRDRSGTKFGKKEARSFLASSGTEAFATSSRKKKVPMVMEDLKGSVDDFKCQADRGREKAAKFHAMRIISKLDNAA